MINKAYKNYLGKNIQLGGDKMNRHKKVMQFLRMYSEIKDWFSPEGRQKINKHKRKMGFGAATSTTALASKFNRIREGEKIIFKDYTHRGSYMTRSHRKNINRISPENNSGEKKKPLSVEAILERSNYTFKNTLIKQFLTENQYKDFVEKYFTVLKTMKAGRTFTPSEEDLKIFRDYNAGELSFEEVISAYNLDKAKTQIKIGKIFVHVQEQVRMKKKNTKSTNKETK